MLALAPGVEPAELQVTIDKGLLVIAGERKNDGPAQSEHTAVYAQERFKGSFRRVISLPDDADPAASTPPAATACCASPCRGAKRPSRARSASTDVRQSFF